MLEPETGLHGAGASAGVVARAGDWTESAAGARIAAEPAAGN